MRVDPDPGVHDFAPRIDDTYYPPEEAVEAATVPFSGATGLTEAGATLADDGGALHELNVGDSAGGWRLVAVTQTPQAAVLERRYRHWGSLAFVGPEGPILKVRLPVGQLSALVGQERGYPSDYIDAVLQSKADVLGEKLLAQGEPSFEACVGLLPELVGYVPLAAESSPRKRVIDPTGRIVTLHSNHSELGVDEVLFDPADHIDDIIPTAAKRGLLGGHLPAIHYGFWDVRAEDGWEELAFSLDTEPELTYVALQHQGKWRCFTLAPLREVERLAGFFEALLAFCEHWQLQLGPGMCLDLPEQRLTDASLAGIARAFTTFTDAHPKYGLGRYAAERHDGFPPTVLWMVDSCLEWGLFDRAERYLTYYFDHFVRGNGTLKYYGPAVSEYGQILDCAARYVRYTGDGGWVSAHEAKVLAIAEHLRSLRRESLEQPENAPARGLLYGSPEADTREETDYHFSGSAWACRGLLQLSRLIQEEGNQAHQAMAEELEQEAAGLRADTMRVARAALVADDRPFLPPYPGIKVGFESMTSGPLASYTNYRYWPELLSAEVLDEDLADVVFEFRRQAGGELLATTRFSGHLDNWPFAHQARALIAHDRVEQFLLGLYGHLAVHQMPGTFCAYEQVAIAGEDRRTPCADYCVPAQLTVPLLVRWMLVYEERDSDTLWLCKAVPRRWSQPGQTFSVRNAPTRWGPVSFTVQPEASAVEVEIMPPPKTVPKLVVRARRPNDEPRGRAMVDGVGVPFDARLETVVVLRPEDVVRLRVEWD